MGQVDNKSRSFGRTNPAFTVTYSGFVSGENQTVLTGEFVGTTPATTNSPAGSYPISGSGQSAGNYAIAYVDGILTIGCSGTVVANIDEIGVVKDRSVTVTAEKLFANDTAAEEAELTLTATSAVSTNGGTVLMVGNAITFTPAAGFSGLDLFTYTVTDGCNTATGSVFVTVLDTANSSANRIGDILLDTDGAHVRFAAIPGFTYLVERSDVSADWAVVGSVLAATDGLMEFLDQNPPPGAVYYRTRTP